MESLKPLFEPLTNLLDRGGVRKDVASIILSAIALLCSFLAPDDMPIDPAWIAIILCGLPIVVGAFVALVTEFDVKADLLVSIALVASIAIGQYFAAGEVALIMQLGALLEERTVARAQRGIERLVELTPRTARLVLEGGEERIVEAEDVERLQVVRVLPGEYVPVDGIVTKGCTSVDESVLTGESMPIDKQEGDEVSSGSLNQFGTIEVRALRVGEDGSIQRMARLVQSADAGKAKIVRLADRWATWIVVGALTSAAGAYLITGDIVRSVTVLVVFCPCSLVLATPTAIVAAIGNATKHGFLVKEGDALERLSGVKEAAFDKTGTLTKGTPEVLGVVAIPGGRFTDESLYEVLAGAESRSEHPLGKAIVACARRAGTIIPEPEEFRMIPGRGVEVRVSGSKVSVGNARMMQEAGLVTEEWRDAGVEAFEQEGCTVSYIAVEREATGVVALTDALRDESVETVRALYALGVSPVLLTGDHVEAARAAARQAGIRTFLASCRPEDKMAYVESRESAGRAVVMIGDGVNDAPALRRAQVGIAVGGVGNDLAVEAADIAIVEEGMGQLAHLVALSRRMMRTIKVNLTFSMTLNFVAIALAILAVLNPVTGALVHNCGSVLVIVNSSLLLRWKSPRSNARSADTAA